MNLRLLLFIPLAVVQLTVPGWMINRQEQILHHGREFKFKTAPVDPYDAFRGRYVALLFAVASSSDHGTNRKVWVRFDVDDKGFAKIREESETSLAGDDVVMATRRGDTLHFPFDRYYMEEHAASKAEAAYRTNSRSEHQKAYAIVRILNGQAAIEELYIDDKPIREFLQTENTK